MSSRSRAGKRKASENPDGCPFKQSRLADADPSLAEAPVKKEESALAILPSVPNLARADRPASPTFDFAPRSPSLAFDDYEMASPRPADLAVPPASDAASPSSRQVTSFAAMSRSARSRSCLLPVQSVLDGIKDEFDEALAAASGTGRQNSAPPPSSAPATIDIDLTQSSDSEQEVKEAPGGEMEEVPAQVVPARAVPAPGNQARVSLPDIQARNTEGAHRPFSTF